MVRGREYGWAAVLLLTTLGACIPNPDRPDRGYRPPRDRQDTAWRDDRTGPRDDTQPERYEPRRIDERVSALPAPLPAWQARPVTADAATIDTTTYLVRPGDTLRAIADRTGGGSEAIARANQLPAPFVVRAGQRLTIPGGRYHLVRAGQTGIAIARAYAVDWSRIIAANDLTAPYTLRVGMRVLIPGTAGGSSAAERAAAFTLDIDDILTGSEPALAANQRPAQPTASPRRVLAPTQALAEPAQLTSGFAWPVHGKIITRFGPGASGEKFNGVNIAVPLGTPILASADGVVAYAGSGVPTLGGLVIVKHGSSWTTVYANASQLLVRRGQAVKRGQTIALSGDSGAASRPEVHFEMRKGRTPVDPQRQLPGDLTNAKIGYARGMTEHTSDLLRLLSTRGYIHQTTDAAALDALAAKQVVPGYIGFDPTAPSLHVGSLVQIMLLRRLQQAGHKPIVLMGGGTGKIGDPSFKDEARKLLDHDGIAHNVASIRRIFERFLTFGDGPSDAIMLDNAEWLDKLEYIPFLRDVGQHFSVNRMLGFDSVKLRLDREQSLSFLEFNYMILQAYDFLELSRRAGCRLQMGGSDQWGNIVNGIELSRRMDGTEVFGITTPLITTADGGKMGKTMSGAVWLHEDQLPHYDYWQFWRNTDDRDVGRFLRLFTDLPLDEIARLEALEGAEINAAKIVLANAATTMCRGEAAALESAETARRTFEEGAAGGSLPTFTVSGDIGIVDALIGLGFAASKGEAKRLIKGGGARVGADKVSDEAMIVSVGDAPVRIAAGKKNHGLLVRG